MAEFNIEIQKGVRKGIPLLIAVEGYSQSGKTKSGLEIAAGICDEIKARTGRDGKLLVCDTENRRALHYADDYTFEHYDMHPPFSPAHYAAVLDRAEAEGFDVIFFDSFSHVWSGEGGVKEWADQLEAGTPKPDVAHPRRPGDAWDWWKDWKVRPVTAPGNWSDPKSTIEPGYRWLINKMLRSPCHIILGLRSDEKLRIEAVPVMENDPDNPGRQRQRVFKGKGQTKTVITAPGDMKILDRFVPDCEKRLPYEITISLLFVPGNIGTPGIPIHRKVNPPVDAIFPEDQFVTRAAGRRLAEWAQGATIAPDGAVFDRKAVLEAMRAAAAAGTAPLQEAWAEAGAIVRRALEPELAGLKAIGRAADEASNQDQQQEPAHAGRPEADERPQPQSPDREPTGEDAGERGPAQDEPDGYDGV